MSSHTRRLRVIVSVALVVAAVVLANRLVDQLHREPVDVLDAGTLQPMAATPYGQEQVIRTPLSDVTVSVGAPTTVVDGDLIADGDHDVRAPEGGALVPLTWRVVPTSPDGYEDGRPIDLRLVTDATTVDLATIHASRSEAGTFETHEVVVALDDDVDRDDLRVELEFDGLTQVLDVGSGEIDDGAAAPLYSAPGHLTSDCAELEDNCEFDATDSSGRVPVSGALIVEGVALRPWDAELGWAEEGRLWAEVRLRCHAPDGQLPTGRRILARRIGSLQVSLADQGAARREVRGSSVTGYATTVFAVSSDDPSGTLAVRAKVTLRDGSTLPVRTVAHLTPPQ